MIGNFGEKCINSIKRCRPKGDSFVHISNPLDLIPLPSSWCVES